jgi:hypothetical protein
MGRFAEAGCKYELTKTGFNMKRPGYRQARLAARVGLVFNGEWTFGNNHTVMNSFSCLRSMRAANSRCSFALRLSPSRSSVSESASEIGMHCLAVMSIVRTRTRPLCDSVLIEIVWLVEWTSGVK